MPVRSPDTRLTPRAGRHPHHRHRQRLGSELCTLAAAGTGQSSRSVTFGAPSAGTATLVAAYGGDGTFAAARTTTTETVASASAGGTPGGTSSGGGAAAGASGGSGSSPGSGTTSGNGPAPTLSGLMATGSGATLTVSCPKGGRACELTVAMTVPGTAGHSARGLVLAGRGAPGRTVTIATAHVTVAAGKRHTVRLTLDRAGRRLLRARRHLRATITVTSAGGRGVSRALTLRATGRRR